MPQQRAVGPQINKPEGEIGASGGFPVSHASAAGAPLHRWLGSSSHLCQFWPKKGVQEHGASPALGQVQAFPRASRGGLWGHLRAGAPGLLASPRLAGWFWEGGLCCRSVLCFHAFLSSCRCSFPVARPWLTGGLSVSPQDTGPRTACRPRGSPAAPGPPVPSPSACPPDSSEPSEGRLLCFQRTPSGQSAVLAPCASPP